jgi:two-component system, cell cycle sensor histidine kinase and response regulator CckA
MDDEDKAKQELISELLELRSRNSELEIELPSLTQSEGQLRSIVHTAREGVCVVQDGMLSFANRSIAKFLGYPEDELIGRPLADFIHPEDREAVIQRFSEQLAGHEKKSRFTFRAADKSGTIKLLEGYTGQISWDGKLGMSLYCIDVSERKRAEEALKESERRYRELVEKANDIIYITDHTGHFLLFNPAVLRVAGYSQDEIFRKPYLDLIHPDHRKEVERFYGLQFVKRIQDTYHEVPIITKEGETVWIGQSVQLVMDGDNVAGFQAICRDITDRKRAEEALQNSEQMLKSLLAASPIGIMFSQHGEIKWGNDAWARMFGFDDAYEYMNQPTGILYSSEEEYELSWKTLYDNLKPGKISEADAKLKRKDATEIDVHIRINFMNPSDPSKGTIAAISDISDRKRSEEELRRSEERLELALRGADLGLWDWNVQTGRAVWSERAMGMLGYRLGEVENDFRTWKSHIHPEDWPRVSYALNGHLEGRLPSFDVEGRFRSKSGEWKWILSQGKIVAYDTDGKPLRMTGTSLDITERKLAEEERECLRAQLVQAQKMEAIGTLTGGIAHEFNNLLTVVSGYAELLLADKNAHDPEHAELQRIVGSARRGADLVNSLLAFSRKSDMRLGPVNLNYEVRQIKKLLDRTLPKMIEIELDLSNGLPTVQADSAQIKQVLMNLALNSRDAMPEGGKFTIQTATLDHRPPSMPPSAQADDYVQLRVSDTGIGMDADTLDRIFDPFYTTQGLACKRGLGLAVVHGIVEQHGGYIKCESLPGQWTSFTICLPVMKAQQPDAVSPETELSGGTETILFVDDEEYIRDLASRFLTRAGYRVITEDDCRIAVDLYEKEQHNISLVILDLMMPKVGGRSCLDALLKIQPNVRVLIASGYSDSDKREELIQAGAKGFVGKPFEMAQLLKAVRDALAAS